MTTVRSYEDPNSRIRNHTFHRSHPSSVFSWNMSHSAVDPFKTYYFCSCSPVCVSQNTFAGERRPPLSPKNRTHPIWSNHHWHARFGSLIHRGNFVHRNFEFCFLARRSELVKSVAVGSLFAFVRSRVFHPALHHLVPHVWCDNFQRNFFPFNDRESARGIKIHVKFHVKLHVAPRPMSLNFVKFNVVTHTESIQQC